MLLHATYTKLIYPLVVVISNYLGYSVLSLKAHMSIIYDSTFDVHVRDS